MSIFFSIAERREARSVRHLRIASPAKAGGRVAEVYREVRADYLLAAPVLLHSPVPDLLQTFWSVFRATLLTGSLPRWAKELIAIEIARQNRCPYCEEAHSLSLQAIDQGGKLETSERASEILTWCRATAGVIENPEARSRLDSPPFTADETAEALGLVLVFHYLNRMVTLFCPESVVQLPALLESLRGPMRRIVRRILATLVRREVTVREPLERSTLPADLAWSASRPAMARALSLWSAALEKVESEIPLAVRDLVRDELIAWRGEELSLTSSWPRPKVSDLAAREQPLATFALLVTRGAYRVTDEQLIALRETGVTDAELLAISSWCAAAAARRVVSWSLPTPS